MRHYFQFFEVCHLFITYRKPCRATCNYCCNSYKIQIVILITQKGKNKNHEMYFANYVFWPHWLQYSFNIYVTNIDRPFGSFTKILLFNIKIVLLVTASYYYTPRNRERRIIVATFPYVTVFVLWGIGPCCKVGFIQTFLNWTESWQKDQFKFVIG